MEHTRGDRILAVQRCCNYCLSGARYKFVFSIPAAFRLKRDLKIRPHSSSESFLYCPLIWQLSAVGWLIVTRGGSYSFSEMLGMEWGGFKWWHMVGILLGITVLFVGYAKLFGQVENELDKLTQEFPRRSLRNRTDSHIFGTDR